MDEANNVTQPLCNSKDSSPDDEAAKIVMYCSLLNTYEEMFKSRYTDKDKYFVEAIEKLIRPPPVVFPWNVKQRRTADCNRYYI